jgi:ribosomal protein S18 acetylase RimI-like enzyme
MAEPPYEIRDYRAADSDALQACFRELQDFEREIDPDRVAADTIAAEYVDWLLEQCRARNGKIAVAELDGRVVGFICVWLEPTLAGMLSRVRKVAYISDLVVAAHFRGTGIGTALLAQGEAFALSACASCVVVGVLAGNRGAREVYRKVGFAEYDLRLVKPLTAPADA